MKLRVATLDDLVDLLPRHLPRRLWQAYVVQVRRSAAFTATDRHGVFAVGGLYPDPDTGEREAWLHLRADPAPRVKDVLLATATVLEHAEGEGPIVCHVAANSARDRRFAEFLGFVSPHDMPATRLTPRALKLTRRI